MPETSIADQNAGAQTKKGTLTVELSYELVQLLSEQLYHSPIKAIEELVVNSFDADASECRIFFPDDLAEFSSIAVYDNGIGMDFQGLRALWMIGRSNKRETDYQRLRKRNQIGKFGIGKLATYALANKLTYISKSESEVLGLTFDFRSLTRSATGGGDEVKLQVVSFGSFGELDADNSFSGVIKGLQLPPEFWTEPAGWTLVVLEDLKPKAQDVRLGRLRWVLSTAMPLQSDFKVFLNGKFVESSKAAIEVPVRFKVGDIPKARLSALSKNTGEPWNAQDGCLSSPSFPDKICGDVIVAEKSLFGGKSADILRSHGFFIKVRGRLINEEDSLFGLEPLSHSYFNNFRADILCDDLDAVITAPREGVGSSELREKFQNVLRELFNEARGRYDEWESQQQEKMLRKREHERRYVNPRLFEHPVADVITLYGKTGGSEADESWFYVELEKGINLSELAREFYSAPAKKYKFEYRNSGPSSRLVRFSPSGRVFYLNADHMLVKAHADDPRTQTLLEDLVTAEVMLEVYLREIGVERHIVGELLERRDALLKSLAQEHFYSLEVIAQTLRDSKDGDYDLEVAVVAAVRALGFVATHVSGPKEPDGIATLYRYPGGARKMTLECKSSKETPKLPQLDFAGLKSHKEKYEAEGCLLVAPSYPNEYDPNGEAAIRARTQGISCWKINRLAEVVAAGESRHITANDVFAIVTGNFDPIAVDQAVEKLLAEPTWERPVLYKSILEALRSMQDDFQDAERTIGHVAGRMNLSGDLKGIKQEEIEDGLKEVAAASMGMLRLSGSHLIINGDLEEIERRVSRMTKDRGKPRRRGNFWHED